MKKSIKSNFIQKSILTILVTILLVNLVMPIISNKVFADTTGNKNKAEYERLKKAYENGDQNVWTDGNRYGYQDSMNTGLNNNYDLVFYDSDGTEHRISYVSNPMLQQDGSTVTEWNLDKNDKDYSVAQNFKNDNGQALPQHNVDQNTRSDPTAPPAEIDDDSGVGGVLLDPFVDFFATIGDAVINLLQYGMNGNSPKQGEFSIHGGFLKKSGEAQDSPLEYGGESASLNVNSSDLVKGFLGLGNDYYVPYVTYSPEQIFANRVDALDINFISPKGTISSKLHGVIAEWYVALRNLSVVGLLSILVYVGIRILISTTASDKAKYKQLLTDWIIALCLLFFLHYIMSFTITMVESIVEAIGKDGEGSVRVSGEGVNFTTNLLGAARFMVQHKNAGTKIAYLVMYLALVVYTVIFTFFYLKRMIMIGFLTMIAPLVALTYPIDKMNDGKAQAFDSWLKEFVYNALIQPFHLIIYMVFVGTALQFAMDNIIYMIAALAFILPAERILRSFFGFDKAKSTLGSVGNLAAAGLGLSALKKLAGGSGGGKKGGQGGSGQEAGNSHIRMNSGNDIDDIDVPGNALAAGAVAGAALGDGGQDNNKQNIFDEDQAIKDRMQAMEDNDYNATYDPEYLALQRQLEENQARREQQQQQSNNQSTQESAEINVEPRRNSAFTNLSRAAGHSIRTKGVRAIKGAAKFAGRTAFKATAGTLAGIVPGAVAIASGGGLKGGAAAFAVGAAIGGRAGSGAFDAITGIPSAARKIGDIADGTNDRQTAAQVKQFKKDNYEALRDRMIEKGWKDENGNEYAPGVIPSRRNVLSEMNKFDDYIKEGLTDVGEIQAAMKGEDIAGSAKNAAVIAKYAKENKIGKGAFTNDNAYIKTLEKVEKDLINRKVPEDKARQIAELTMKTAAKQNGVKNLSKLPTAASKQRRYQPVAASKAKAPIGPQSGGSSSSSSSSGNKTTLRIPNTPPPASSSAAGAAGGTRQGARQAAPSSAQGRSADSLAQTPQITGGSTDGHTPSAREEHKRKK